MPTNCAVGNKIAEILNIERNRVSAGFNDAGYPDLSNVNIDLMGRVMSDFQKGVSLQASCVANDVPQSEVEVLIRCAISKFSMSLAQITQPDTLQVN